MHLRIRDRRPYRRPGLFVIAALVMIVAGCSCASHTMRAPDREAFYANVSSPDLRAAFDKDRLSPGMPYFVIDQLFAEWKNDRQRPVPGVGSRQELREEEGWGRVYHDPHIKTFMKEFKTADGTVAVWYDYPDFYQTGVRVGDTLALFWADTVMASPISCMLDGQRLAVPQGMAGLPADTFLYAEIRHVDNPRYRVSHWYRLEADGPTTFDLMPTGFDLYRIEWIEVNGKPVDFFQWRTSDENH